MSTTEPLTLELGVREEGDAVFIIRQSPLTVRIATESTRPGGRVYFGNQGDERLPITFLDNHSPFNETNLELGNDYEVSQSASGKYAYTLGSVPYSLYIEEGGAEETRFTWEGKLLARQNTDDTCKVLFTRAEDHDKALFPGELMILVTKTPNDYQGSIQLSVPAGQPNGCWEPGVRGNYRITATWATDPAVGGQNSSRPDPVEDTGSEEGDLTIDPPPP